MFRSFIPALAVLFLALAPLSAAEAGPTVVSTASSKVKIEEVWTDLRTAVADAKATSNAKVQKKASERIHSSLTSLRTELVAAQQLPDFDKKLLGSVVENLNVFMGPEGFVVASGFNASHPSLLGASGVVADWSAFDTALVALNPSRTYLNPSRTY